MQQNFMSDYLEKLQALNQEWTEDLERKQEALSMPFDKAISKLNNEDLGELCNSVLKQPTALADVQQEWWQKQMQILSSISMQTPGKEAEEVVSEDKWDKRFSDKTWTGNPLYSFVKQSYLLYGQTLQNMIDSAEGVDDKAKERLQFFSRHIINSFSPTNFVATNPELIKLTLETDGQNLVKGTELFLEDMESSADILNIRMTDRDAFHIGKELACTAGKVVYKTDLFELIQYSPSTPQVQQTPVMIVPPFINKYYILDLREKNSMMRWLVDQGHTVFMISWRNPDASMSELAFENYVTDGVLKAVSTIEAITGEKEVNGVGYCIGGTLLATAMAYQAGKRMKPRIKSATFFTTLLEFSQPGELGVYINEELVSALELQNNQQGYMDGRQLAVTFSLLRENSLYWNYYVDNYLKGNRPFNFDMLHWNCDSTNVAATTHNFILRQLYLENKLCQPGAIKIAGVKIDLSKINVPTYFVSAKEDHIALWQGTYRGAQLLGKEPTFVLGESGHVAGIVNHPDKDKYGYWVGNKMLEDADSWEKQAKHSKGSWWPHWNQWLQQFSPEEAIESRQPGSDEYSPLYDAPGKYVRQLLPIEPDCPGSHSKTKMQ